MASEERVRFQLEEYYDVLMSASLKQKLKPFVRQFKKKNIPFIYETVVNTMQVLTGKHEIPLMKFNALMATKLFFDTAEYVAVVLIEVYLLPLVLDVALYRLQKRSEEGLTLYFTERGGYEATKEMKRMGFNFVLLAIEFIFMSAQVKPFRNLENQELREQSNFAKVARALQEKGVALENYKFYIPSYVAQTRKKYLKRLSKLNAEEYTDFFLKLICDELNLNRKPQLDTRKLFVFGDAFLTIPLMHVCEDELGHMQANFVNKKKYLGLLGDFMRLGDIYALLIITRSAFLEEIFNVVQKVKGETGLDAGEGIYPDVEAARADKKEFYVEFLKHIEIWAQCHPVDEEGEPTDAKKIFDILKGQRKFVFPSNILIAKIRAEMQENLKLNQKRNEKLIKLVDEYSSEDSRRKPTSSRDSKLSKRSEGLKVDSCVNGKLGSYIEFDELEEMVLDAKKKLDRIIQKDGIEATMRALEKFRTFWDANAGKNEIEADQSGDVEIVLEEGDLCTKVIEMVLPVYQLYAKGLITFEDYKDRVDLLMKKEAEDSALREVSAGDTSFQKGLEKSEAAEKFEATEKFEDCYEKSSLSQLQSNIKRQELSIKSSCKAREETFRHEQSESRQSVLKENDAQIESEVSQRQRKQESNISFREESVASSQSDLHKISEKESVKSESLLQEESFRKKPSFSRQPSLSKQESSLQEASLRESRASVSRASSRSGNKRLIERKNQSPGQQQQRSKVSNQSQSVLSNESVNYKDALASRNPKAGYEDYYNNSKESFISSQNSIAEQLAHRQQENGSSIRGESSVSGRSKQVKLVKALASKNEDYYGAQIKEGKTSNLSKGSRLRESRSKLSSSKISNGESRLGRQSENRQNNYTQSILPSYQSLNSNREAQNEARQSKISIIKTHNILSPAGNTGNFSLLEKYEQESVIHEPEFDPLLHSFHEEKSVEATLPSKISSFRECFEVNNEIIMAKEGKDKLLKFTKAGKIANFIEAAHPRHTPRNSTIVDIISERNAKRSIDSYCHLREKSRATETLSERIKSLESFNKNLRIKQLVKNQQSRNQTPSRPQERNQVALKGSRANGSEPVSFYNDPDSSHQQSEAYLKSETGEMKAGCLDVSRMINPKIYSHYFPAGKSDKLKKCMLKSKSLLIKNEEFEVGCVTNRRERSLEISLFVTPLKDSIEDLRLSVMHDHNLKVRLFTQAIDLVRADQQEYITIEFEVQNVPYVMPTLSFKFKSNRNYAHNHLLVPLPLAFTKFAVFHPTSHLALPQRHSAEDVISIEEFKFNPKLINSERMRESLANFELIGKENRVAHYGSEAYFKGKIFALKFAVSEKGWMTLEGRNMTGDHKNTKFLQFLLVTFREIFSRDTPAK